MSPCTLLVERELAMTLPASCLVGMLSGIRSTKLVSSRLKAVVCELAMLPEMFSSAKDCARMPVTAVVRAPKIPITHLHVATGRKRKTRRWPQYRCKRCKPRARQKYMIFQLVMRREPVECRAGYAASRQNLPGRRPLADAV